MSKSIIRVRFADRHNEGVFSQQKYTYYLDTGLLVEPGQIITVPTKFGHTKAMVSDINLSDSVIDIRYADSMKTITAADLETEPRAGSVERTQHDAEDTRTAKPTLRDYSQISMDQLAYHGVEVNSE